MENAPKSERDLILEYKEAKKKLEDFQVELDKIAASFDRAELALIEYMQAKDLKTTGKYAGIGSVTLVKPRLYANYLKENEEQVFAFLKDLGRGDLIKETVNKQSLSGFVKEIMESEQPVAIPEIQTSEGPRTLITYHLKPSIKLNAA